MLLSFIFPISGTPKVIIPETGNVKVNLVNLLIPGNLISSLERNYIPAVVIFSVFFGLAMQRVKNKSTFLEITGQIKNACVVIWNWIVYVAPIGVFALFASTAGTVRQDEIGELLTSYINYWLEIKRREGISGKLKDHWIKGNQPSSDKKRWCILRDVFHLINQNE